MSGFCLLCLCVVNNQGVFTTIKLQNEELKKVVYKELPEPMAALSIWKRPEGFLCQPTTQIFNPSF
jgi:hypothetical protein